MIILAISLLVASLFAKLQDVRKSTITTKVIDPDKFEDSFDMSLPDLIREGIVRYDVNHSGYLKLSKVLVFLGVLCVVLWIGKNFF